MECEQLRKKWVNPAISAEGKITDRKMNYYYFNHNVATYFFFPCSSLQHSRAHLQLIIPVIPSHASGLLPPIFDRSSCLLLSSSSFPCIPYSLVVFMLFAHHIDQELMPVVRLLQLKNIVRHCTRNNFSGNGLRLVSTGSTGFFSGSGLALAPRIKLNRETKNFSRYASNLRLMETSLQYGISS